MLHGGGEVAPEHPLSLYDYDSHRILRVADLAVDLDSRRAWLGIHELALSQREFDLLAYLCEHRGRPVSRSELLSTVWHKPVQDDSNLVEVYIGYLRRKLEQDGSRRLIWNLRGRGYVLSDSSPEP